MSAINIIIPHKNTPQLLQRLLDSIPEIDGVRVIVVDDGSDNNIVDFTHFPGNNRQDTTIILQKESHGAGSARNVGLKSADAKYILFADSDDFFLPGSFRLFMDYVNTDYDIIFFNVKALQADLKTLGKRADYYNDFFRKHDEQLMRYTSNVPWAKMIKLELIRKYNIRFDETSVANDAYFSCLAAIHANQVHTDNHVVYCCTETEGSLKMRSQNKTDRQIRYEVSMRCNRLLRQNGHGTYHLNAISWLFQSRHPKDWLPLKYIVRYVIFVGTDALREMYWFLKYH